MGGGNSCNKPYVKSGGGGYGKTEYTSEQWPDHGWQQDLNPQPCSDQLRKPNHMSIVTSPEWPGRGNDPLHPSVLPPLPNQYQPAKVKNAFLSHGIPTWSEPTSTFPHQHLTSGPTGGPPFVPVPLPARASLPSAGAGGCLSLLHIWANGFCTHWGTVSVDVPTIFVQPSVTAHEPANHCLRCPHWAHRVHLWPRTARGSPASPHTITPPQWG